MSILTTLKIAENLWNDGFVTSMFDESIYNVATGEKQYPPHDVHDALLFITKFVDRNKRKISSN